MNSAIVFALAALVAVASANTSPGTEEQQQQEQQHQQQYAQESVMQPVQISALPIDVYGRQAYRAVYAVANNDDQKQSGSAVQGGDGHGHAVYRAGNYVAVPYPIQAQVINPGGNYLFHPVGSPLGLGARLGGSIHISPAARGFALGGLTGLGVGLASRGLLAGSLAGPIGLGLHGALSTPALGVGLGAGAAALLG